MWSKGSIKTDRRVGADQQDSLSVLSLSSLETCTEGVVQLGSPREKRTSKTGEVLRNAFAIWLITLTSFLLYQNHGNIELLMAFIVNSIVFN